MPRYKLIFHATVGEVNGQAVRQASRSLWDKDVDRSATATFKNVRPAAVPPPARFSQGCAGGKPSRSWGGVPA